MIFHNDLGLENVCLGFVSREVEIDFFEIAGKGFLGCLYSTTIMEINSTRSLIFLKNRKAMNYRCRSNLLINRCAISGPKY